jgi:hypothetical protein
MEYIVSSGHVAAPVPPTWRGQALFATWLEVAAWTPRLHNVLRGTSDSGYRQYIVDHCFLLSIRQKLIVKDTNIGEKQNSL